MKEKPKEEPKEEVKVQLITHEQYLNLKLETIIELLIEQSKKIEELTTLAKNESG